MTERLDSHKVEVCETFARGQPVLVIGPGCQRIAYDAAGSHVWQRVRRRMRALYADAESDDDKLFLERLWESKLSDHMKDALAKRGGIATSAAYGLRPTVDVGPAAAPAGPFESLQVQGLALPALSALTICTTLLGDVIKAGDTPVVSWSSVAHPRDLKDDRAPAVTHLQLLIDRAEALAAWSGGTLSAGALGEFGFGEDGRPPEPHGEELQRLLGVLRPGAVATRCREFVARCLASTGAEAALTGANVEWLADLWWHIMICDAGVPPSQGELAFYVNLSENADPRPRALTRPRPGELRETPGRQWHPTGLRELLNNRLRTGANGLEQRDPRGFDPHLRVKLARSLAATMITVWQDNAPAHGDDLQGEYSDHELDHDQDDIPFASATWPEDRAGSIDTPPAPIALVANHDLLLERELMTLSPAGAKFHVLVPVWLTSKQRSDQWPEHFKMTWLWGTYASLADRERFEPRYLTSHTSGRLSWDWYRPLGGSPDTRKVEGPVVIRVGGSPLLEFGDDATNTALELEARTTRSGIEYLYPATVISEVDALTAIMELAGERPGKTESGLPKEVGTSLSWDARSWIFLGDSLPDWIPRLRLLFNARTRLPLSWKRERGDTAADEQSEDDGPDWHAELTDKIAIDLAFDWPEEAMLATLSIDAYIGNLRWLASYWTTPAARAKSEIEPFLGRVGDLARRAWR
jgi:hypothetical protein